MPDEPTSIPTSQMPELAADIRLVLEALESISASMADEFCNDLVGRAAVEWGLGTEPDQNILAAYDRLKAAFGKDD